MGRKISISSREQLVQAVAYLRRAQKRNTTDFFVKPQQAEQELERLQQLLTTLKDEEIPGVFASWMDLHLSNGGRVRLLGVLRRKRADSAPTRTRRRSISVSPAVYKELERLAKASGGIPMSKLLEGLAAIANVDKELQDKLLNLALALSLK